MWPSWRELPVSLAAQTQLLTPCLWQGLVWAPEGDSLAHTHAHPPDPVTSGNHPSWKLEARPLEPLPPLSSGVLLLV